MGKGYKAVQEDRDDRALVHGMRSQRFAGAAPARVFYNEWLPLSTAEMVTSRAFVRLVPDRIDPADYWFFTEGGWRVAVPTVAPPSYPGILRQTLRERGRFPAGYRAVGDTLVPAELSAADALLLSHTR